jgi:hypothetical protein
VGCEQLALLVQSTQPSVGLHCWPPWQLSLPFTPQSALPAPIDELAPPHAMMTPKTRATAVPRILMRRRDKPRLTRAHLATRVTSCCRQAAPRPAYTVITGTGRTRGS